MGIVEGKRIVVTGVLTKRSIAHAAAARLQREGAEIVLTGFGRGKRLTQRAAQSLPEPVDVLELDVLRAEDLEALAGELERRWGRVDGVLHAIANAPAEVLADGFLTAPPESVELTMRTSAYSLHTLTMALLPLLERAEGQASIVALGVEPMRALENYGWMGVAKAGLAALTRYHTMYLGPRGIRSNLVASGPLHTVAAGSIPDFGQLVEPWLERAPLGWRLNDADVAAGPICFLLSDLARGVSGQTLRVDGGLSALAP